jgi:hypothetical protein
MYFDPKANNIAILKAMGRIETIKEKISKGVSFTDLQKQYPITKALYQRLGGTSKKGISVNRSSSEEFVQNLVKAVSVNSPPTPEYLLGSLMGDSWCYRPMGYTTLPYYGSAHYIGQIQYIAWIIKAMGSLVSSVSYKEAFSSSIELADAQIHILSKSSLEISPYYDMFYTYPKEGFPLQKDCLQEEILEKLSWEELSYWVMDDGGAHGSTGCFSLSIGKLQQYPEVKMKRVVEILSDRFGIPFYLDTKGIGYLIYTKVESSAKVLSNLAPYLLPDMAYKLRVLPDRCGETISKEWIKKVEEVRKEFQHPYLLDHSYKSYTGQDNEEGRKIKKAFLTQALVRGWPYLTFSNTPSQEVTSLYNKSVEGVSRIIEGVYTFSNKSSAYPSLFFPSRPKVPVKGRKSPYQVYYDKRSLSKVLDEQLKSKDGVSTSNVRSAIGYYSGGQIAGQFPVPVARDLIRTFSQEGGSVLDPCAGWGSRGFSAMIEGRSYFGIDANPLVIEGAKEMLKDIKGRLEKVPSFDVVLGRAEDSGLYPDILFDMAITSPPYFDTERYSNHKYQSFIRYPEEGLWLTSFLDKMIQNVYKHLRTGGHFILNIKEGHLLEASKGYSKCSGFSLLEERFFFPYGKASVKKVKEVICVYKK